MEASFAQYEKTLADNQFIGGYVPSYHFMTFT